jgi:hypothetical protein
MRTNNRKNPTHQGQLRRRTTPKTRTMTRKMATTIKAYLRDFRKKAFT